METTTSARPRRGSIFRRRASTSDTQPKPNLRHAKNASAPSLEPSPVPYHTAGMSASTDSLLSVNGTRANIIPDALESLPSWYNKEIDVPSSIHLIRARYPIHNPAGPRFYRNVHLRPPELLPPMEAFTSTVPSASASASQAGPSSSRTTSTSPAPTPASSTSKLVDPSIKPRTRKLSNNVAHDNVDLLDVTDPLGNNWHHTSPYDALAAPSPVSPDGADRGPRSRLPSAASRPKTNAPSPLSQSTSAVHLAQEPDVRPKQKRRRTFKGVFSTRDDIDIHPQPSSSEPTTPFERGASPYLAVPQVGHKHKSSRVPRGLKSVSTTSIPHIANSIFGSHDKDKSGKREKRGSVLGKLARGFSVLRRPTHSRGSSDVTGLSISDRMSMGTDPSRLSSVPPASGRHLSPEKGEARRRVPVPSVEPSTATSLSAEPEPPAPPQRASNTRQYDEYVYDDDGQSVLSVDASYTGGRLTIVNPDIPRPDEVEDSPVSTLMPLRATSPVARPPSVQVHVQAEIAGMARIQSIKRTSAEVPDAPQPPAAHPHSHSHSVRPPSQQSTHSRSASSRLSSQHGGRHSANNHASHHHRIEKELPVPTPTPPPFITTEISTSPITLSRPLSVLSPPPVLAPELKPSHSRDSHRSSRKPPSSSSSAPAPTPAPSQPSIPMSPPAQAPVPTPASSTDTVTPTTASVASPPPASNSALPPSPFRRDKAASQPMMSPPFIPFPTDLGTPLSRASLLVNPPTPTAGPVPIPPVARMPSVFARRAKEKEKEKDAPSGPRSRSGSTSPTKHEDEEKERKEKEREAKEKEERERRERERRAEKERLERERAELDRRVREKERQLELERERLEVERRVREKEREIELERERERERERKRAEEKERERMARERERAAEKERLEHERLELERRLWERAERERLERERQQREQLEREKAEKERVEREKRREEERLERERRRDDERRREDDRRREKEEHDRRERDERDRRERERSRERRRERERSRERRKEHEREERDRSRERREREKEKERKRALEKEMYREEREREKERERARSRSPFAKRAATSSGAVGSAKARETETFRLVRTLSGGNGISGTTIVAEGQHYELVGDAPKRSKTTSKEDPSRRGSRREKDKEREHRSEDSPAKPVSPFSAHVRSASSPVAPTRKESTRRKPNDLPRLRERQPSTSSASNRPTSDLPSAADLHAVRARDAWEMDRLWRGHSAVYDPSLMYAQSIAAGSTSTVQGGMPMSPPQSGVFESPYMHGNLAAFTGHTPNYVFPSGLRSYPDLGSIPSIASPEPEARELRSPMRNPLPSPPKPSAFRLPPRVELKDHGLTAPS